MSINYLWLDVDDVWLVGNTTTLLGCIVIGLILANGVSAAADRHGLTVTEWCTYKKIIHNYTLL